MTHTVDVEEHQPQHCPVQIIHTDAVGLLCALLICVLLDISIHFIYFFSLCVLLDDIMFIVKTVKKCGSDGAVMVQ